MTKAKINYSNQVDKHQKKFFYDIRDKVWLFSKNIDSDRFSKKLDHKMISSFEIVGKKDISSKLKLSQVIKIYNIFHSNFFQKDSTNLLTSQVNKLELLVIINNEKN